MIYVISDIHGCFDQYRALLEKIHFQDSDTLYVLGDVIDRRPGGVKILQDMMVRPNVVPLLGNHEYMMAVSLNWLTEEITPTSLAKLDEFHLGAFRDWMSNGGEPTLLAFRELDEAEREDILD